MRFAAAVLLAAGMIGGCAALAASPSRSPAATAIISTPTASPTAPAPPLAGLVPTEIDPVVELRVWIHGDVGGMGRTPNLAVYRDGTVLRSTDQGPRITRLAPEGLARLKEAAGAGGLLDTSGVVKPDPDYAGGFVSYVIELRKGGELIRRATTNSLTAADRPAGEALIARAEELVDLDRWLQSEAWVVGPADAELYVPANLLLKVTIWDTPGGTAALDLEDVAWPLPGELVDFGTRLTDPPLGEGSIARCAPVSLADAARVQAALFDAPWVEAMIPMSERMAADLSWESEHSHITVSLANLLPDDPLDCEIDQSWP
jgi:hypothetical protein